MDARHLFLNWLFAVDEYEHETLKKIDRKLNDIEDLVHHMRRDLARWAHQTAHFGRHTMASLDEIQMAVQQNAEVTTSAVALIEGLADQLDDLDPTDPAAITALADQLRTQSQALADAVIANTPEQGGGDAGGDTPPIDVVTPDDGGTTPPDGGDDTGSPTE